MGQYGAPLRSQKGKLKGLQLQSLEGCLIIKLPKYLRPMLVRELSPGDWIQVWAYPEGDRWQALDVLPWPEQEVPDALRQAVPPLPSALVPASPREDSRPGAQVCIQVCRKGKCFKQGGQQIWQALEAEVEANPDLQHIAIEATGCMKACKQGPNLRVLPQGKLHSRINPDRAVALLDRYR